MTNENKKRIFPYIIIAILALIMWCMNGRLNEANQTIAEKENFITALSDTLETTKNKLGEETAKITAFQAEKVESFLALQTLNEEVLHLQNQVEKYEKQIAKGGSVTVIGSTTNVSGTVPTSITKPDTVFTDSSMTIYAVYEFEMVKDGEFNDSTYQWVNINGSADKDSTDINVTVNNEYTVVIGFEKQDVEGKKRKQKVPFASVTNHNPYSSTKTLRTFRTTVPPDKKKGIGMNIGVGAGLSYAIDGKLRPTINLGVNFGFNKNLFEF